MHPAGRRFVVDGEHGRAARLLALTTFVPPAYRLGGQRSVLDPARCPRQCVLPSAVGRAHGPWEPGTVWRSARTCEGLQEVEPTPTGQLSRRAAGRVACGRSGRGGG